MCLDYDPILVLPQEAPTLDLKDIEKSNLKKEKIKLRNLFSISFYLKIMIPGETMPLSCGTTPNEFNCSCMKGSDTVYGPVFGTFRLFRPVTLKYVLFH